MDGSGSWIRLTKSAVYAWGLSVREKTSCTLVRGKSFQKSLTYLKLSKNCACISLRVRERSSLTSESLSTSFRTSRSRRLNKFNQSQIQSIPLVKIQFCIAVKMLLVEILTMLMMLFWTAKSWSKILKKMKRSNLRPSVICIRRLNNWIQKMTRRTRRSLRELQTKIWAVMIL